MKKSEIKFVRGSGTVFRDFGHANPDVEQLKASLAAEIIKMLDRSGLNRTLAMQALMDLSEDDAALRARVVPVVRESLEHGTPAMRARARKLLGVKR